MKNYAILTIATTSGTHETVVAFTNEQLRLPEHNAPVADILAHLLQRCVASYAESKTTGIIVGIRLPEDCFEL